MLGTLCFYYLNHSIYAEKNDGWFYKDQKTLFEQSNLSEAQANRVLLKLIMKRLIERRSGTNHKCTHYRLHKGIRDLMPKNPEVEDENFANERLVDSHNEEKNANERLEKKRLDESRKDESSLENKNVSFAPFNEGATIHKIDWDDLINNWKNEIKKATRKEELELTKEHFIEEVKNNGVPIPYKYKTKVDNILDSYNWRYAILK